MYAAVARRGPSCSVTTGPPQRIAVVFPAESRGYDTRPSYRLCASDATRNRRYQPIERQYPSCGLLSRPPILDGSFGAPCAQCGWKASAESIDRFPGMPKSSYPVLAPLVPTALRLNAIERRIVLTLLRMMWRDAKAAGHRDRMESIAQLGKTIRLTRPSAIGT